MKQYNLTHLQPEQRDFLHQQIQNLIAEYEKIKAETKVLDTQVGLNNSQTKLNNQNVVTQKRYAKLLGQQTLTEEQKTLFQQLQNHFGSADKVAEIVQKVRPHNFTEFVNFLTESWFDDAKGTRTSPGKVTDDVDSIAKAWNNRRKGMAVKK